MVSDKKYYVDFGPELLKLLGPNLYTNIYYVLGEIIANAYDADADNVYIIYNNIDNTIIIEDDGSGMSYEEINNKFLPVGVPSRVDIETSYTKIKGRKRMGRKGIGKLAALSVAENIKIISTHDNDKSGCILSLNISQKRDENGKYRIPSVDENEIKFKHIKDGRNGSAMVMENSRYAIHNNIESAKNNIALIFPFAGTDFKIHLENVTTEESTTIEDSVQEIIKLSDALITFSNTGSKYHGYLAKLHENFDNDRYYRSIKKVLANDKLPKKKQLNLSYPAIEEKMLLLNNESKEKEYTLSIEGWISTYYTTKEKIRNADFPANHISIISNDKLGQFDILSDISTDRMAEANVVGQFYVDLLEETELPDIASSNRQGYKEDDKRFFRTKELIKQKALKAILDLKKEATDEKNYLKNMEKKVNLEKQKDQFDSAMKKIVNDPEFKKVITNSKEIQESLKETWELKNTLVETYKKVMISHDSEDKDLINELEKILHFCGFEKEEIIYTSSNYYESTIGAYGDIFEILKKFFVDTVRRPDLSVIYILNERFIRKWNPTLEAGAGWVLNTQWFPMYTDSFHNVLPPFNQTIYTPVIKCGLNDREAELLANAIYDIATRSNKNDQTPKTIVEFIKNSTRLCANEGTPSDAIPAQKGAEILNLKD